MENSQRDFTRDKLKKMGSSGAVGQPPGNIDSDKDAEVDAFGNKAGKNSAQLKGGGSVHGKGKSPHMGRAGRSMGGRVGRASGGKTPVTAQNETDNSGKKVNGGVVGTVDVNKKADVGPIRLADLPKYQRDDGTEAKGDERPGRARGGKTGKGKTVVNVIVGNGKGDQPAPPPGPPPMAPPMPPPQPPQHPPGAPPPGAGGPGGAPPIINMPPGGGGAPPPGMPPMGRARGGRIEVATEGHKVFKTPSAAHVAEKAGAGSGKGRMEKARRQG